MLFFRSIALLALMGVVLPVCAQSPKTQAIHTPLLFEPNQGQASPTVRFLSRSNGHSLLLTDTDAVLSFANPAVSVRMKLIGQNPRPVIEGLQAQPGVTNYYRGNDPAHWKLGVPHFEKVKYNAVYPGIDLIYYGNERQLEYDFDVHPGHDPSRIQFEFQGVDRVAVGPEGDLILTTSAGEVRHHRPVAYQRRGSTEIPVEASFVLEENRVGFHVGVYDRSLLLTIDPTLVWSSYLGSTGLDQGNDVTVDSAGNVYIVGYTQTIAVDPPADGSSLPVPALVTPIDHSVEAFVTRLDPSGAISYTTYYGGTGVDEGHSLALDNLGSLYAVGYTTSTDFPVIGGFQTTLNGVQDAYVVKLDGGTGALQFSSYLGGEQGDRAFGVAADSAGNAYVAGGTLSRNFPTSNAFQSRFGNGLRDGFLTRITPAGTIASSTYLGGSGDEQIFDVVVDVDGNAVVTGYTSSQNFPVANALFRDFRGGGDDVFITKFNVTGTALVFSTYWGGFDSDNGVRLTVDNAKNIYVTGTTKSSVDFPRKNAPQFFHGGVYDAFLIKLRPDGQDYEFSTFIGADDTESGTSVAVDDDGFIYLTGFTNSLGFYVINAPATGGFLRGIRDGFVMKLSSDASVVVFSGYLGDFGAEGGTSIALDAAGNAYVTGYTTSFFFPVTPNAFQSAFTGVQDAFIVKINSDDVKTSEPFSFPVNGGVRISTAGQTSQPFFGYVAVDVVTGLPPSGLEIVDLRSRGTLINEVSVPVPELRHVGRVFVSTSPSSATALTIVNPNDTEATIAFYFTAKGGGGTHVFGSFTIPAHSQSSGFLYSQPFNLAFDLLGTLTFTSDLPVSAIGLLSSSGQAGTTNVYLPIIDPYTANNHPVAVPQFVDGGGWTTLIHLVNPTEDTITGEIRLLTSPVPDQPGVPFEVSSDQGLGSVFTYSIEPRSLFTIVSRGENSEIRVGFAEIVPSSGSSTPLAHAILNSSNGGFLATTVEGVRAGGEFRMYAESSLAEDPADPENQGLFPIPLAATPALALANTSDAEANVTLSLVGFDGTEGLSGTVTLPPKGHFARFLREVAGFEALPSNYAGVLRVTTSQPGVTFAGFRARYNEQSQFLITLTGPLRDVGNMNPVIFPHLVDGGGFATQFILIPVSGSGASGTIRYLNPSGNPINVSIAPQ